MCLNVTIWFFFRRRNVLPCWIRGSFHHIGRFLVFLEIHTHDALLEMTTQGFLHRFEVRPQL